MDEPTTSDANSGSALRRAVIYRPAPMADSYGLLPPLPESARDSTQYRCDKCGDTPESSQRQKNVENQSGIIGLINGYSEWIAHSTT